VVLLVLLLNLFGWRARPLAPSRLVLLLLLSPPALRAWGPLPLLLLLLLRWTVLYASLLLLGLLLVCCPVLRLCITIGMGRSSCHSTTLSWLCSTAIGSSSSSSSSWWSSNVAVAPSVCSTSRTSGGCRSHSRCFQRLLRAGLPLSNCHQARQLGLRLWPLPRTLLLVRMRRLLLLLLVVMSLLDGPLSSSGSVMQQPRCAPCRPGLLAASTSISREGTLQLP
jgi:hypothetical protein